MKKCFVLFAAMAVTFLMSVDLHSSNEGVGGNERIIVYCALQWNGVCKHDIKGDACYLVDEECKWMDEEDQPEA